MYLEQISVAMEKTCLGSLEYSFLAISSFSDSLRSEITGLVFFEA